MGLMLNRRWGWVGGRAVVGWIGFGGSDRRGVRGRWV